MIGGSDFLTNFKIGAIHHVAFHRNQIIYIIAETGPGKSAILLSIGSLQARVTLSMVPLVGLGSNPVVDEHCIIADRGVVFARDVVEHGGVVVSERRHGVIDNWHGVVVTLGINVWNGVTTSLII